MVNTILQVCMQAPVIIGSNGVEKIVKLELSSEEKKNFQKSVQSVKELFEAAKKLDPSLR